ncbi:MAG: hypothetical protein M1837_000017 [Sclerophora amabilis]|nr:MAG: hypothetical protein M1837_000017 [Sclerophora amabilis]
MDSMRSLGTSLPVSASKSGRENPPEHLLQAFRSAALSVTTLYKTAVSGQSQLRQSGYQEALDDLLAFLDREKLGLGDGEGWKVRQWATERLEGGESGAAATGLGDSDDEKVDAGTRARSSSPALSRKEGKAAHNSTLPASVRSVSSARTTSAPPTGPAQHEQQHQQTQQQANVAFQSSAPFTFRSSPEYPQQNDNDLDVFVPESTGPTAFNTQSFDSQAPTQSSNPSAPSVRLEVIPRSSRNRRGNPNRMATRSSNSLSAMGSKAGLKRLLPFEEFFDVRDTGGGKDSYGAGVKRGRYS